MAYTSIDAITYQYITHLRTVQAHPEAADELSYRPVLDAFLRSDAIANSEKVEKINKQER